MSNEQKKTLRLEGYALDENLVSDGAPVSFGKNKDGTHRIALIKPSNSVAFQDRLDALNKRSGRSVHRDPEVGRQNYIIALAEKSFVKLVFGEIDGKISAWYDEDGEPIADTVANRQQLLTASEHLQSDVFDVARVKETFMRDQLEADLGNSPKSSTGS